MMLQYICAQSSTLPLPKPSPRGEGFVGLAVLRQGGKSFEENGKMRIFAAPKKKSDDFWCNGVLPERV